MGLEKTLKESPRKLDEFETQIRTHGQGADTLRRRKDSLQKNREQKIQFLHAERDNLKRIEAKQLAIKTEREQQAVMKELDNSKRMIDTVSDEIKKLEVDIGIQTSDLEKLEAAMNTAREQLTPQIEAINKAAEEAKKQLDSMFAARNELIKKVDDRWYRIYERVRTVKGRGIVPVEYAPGAKKSARCTGCNMTVQMQRVNQVLKKQELQTCDYCGRILYWAAPPDEVEETEAEAKPKSKAKAKGA